MMMGAVRREHDRIVGQIGSTAGAITSSGTLTVPNIIYSGYAGHAFAFSWDGAATHVYVDGTDVGTIGDITSVAAGNGLTGGGTSGALSLAISGSYSGNFGVTGNINASGSIGAGSMDTGSIATGVLYGDSSGNYNFASQGTATIGNGTFRAQNFIDNDTGNGLSFSGGNPQINGGLIVQPISGQQDGIWCYANLRVFNGHGYQPGGGVWSDSSDSRLKKNVEPFARGLSEIRRLRPVSFEFNGLAETPDDGQKYHGLVAQEALDIMPEMVGTQPMRLNPDGPEEPVYTLNATAVIWALVNAATELADTVQGLTVRVKQLETALVR
jgi:hypothetical protein